jgi:hypothetical protein
MRGLSNAIVRARLDSENPIRAVSTVLLALVKLWGTKAGSAVLGGCAGKPKMLVWVWVKVSRLSGRSSRSQELDGAGACSGC